MKLGIQNGYKIPRIYLIEFADGVWSKRLTKFVNGKSTWIEIGEVAANLLIDKLEKKIRE